MRKSQSKGKKIETKILEEETRRMQEKLHDLKKQIQLQKSQRDQKAQTGSRWKQANTNVPLRGYAHKVIEQQKNLFKKHGITPTTLTTRKLSMTQAASNHVKSKIQTNTVNQFIQFPTDSSETVYQPPMQNLESRFGKAIMTTQKVYVQDPVSKLLQVLGLTQYQQMFENNHIDDMQLITKQVLEQMSIPVGHRIKIMKKVDDWKENRNKQNQSSILKQQEVTIQTEKTHQNQQQIVPGNKQEQQQDQSTEQGGKLLQGEYDQEKNARQFQEALNAYRGVIKQIQDIALQTDYFQQPNPTPSHSQHQTSKKYVCFSCYKSFTNQPFYLNNRPFCSQTCQKKYSISIGLNCPKCHKSFNKFQGFCHNTIRYCSIECSPEARKMQELFVQWRREEKKNQLN